MAEGNDNRHNFRDRASQMSHHQTSDEYLYSEASSSDETNIDSHGLARHQIREYDLVEQEHTDRKQHVDLKGAKCNSKECIINLSGNFALYLCYVCNLLLCGECMLKHDKTHEFVSVESETDERRGMAEMFVGRMRSERLGRGIDFDRENVRVHGRVNVKHWLDESICFITGLSGLGNKRWVALDRNNYCMKILCFVSNTLLRYIKFGSKPFGVTEIKVQRKSIDTDSASDSKTFISGVARDEPDKHCLLAITFPDKKQIWFIDMNKTPAVKTETIKMDKECWSLEFSQEKIFTLCKEDVEPESVSSICILSTEGNQLKVIKIPGLCFQYINDTVIYKDQVYFSDWSYNKVLCINVEDGKRIFEHTLEGSRPAGISVDHNNGTLYLCGRHNNKVYKLSPDLHECEPLNLDTDYTEKPVRLCFNNNKLFVSHLWLSSLRNVVTVVQLT